MSKEATAPEMIMLGFGLPPAKAPSKEDLLAAVRRQADEIFKRQALAERDLRDRGMGTGPDECAVFDAHCLLILVERIEKTAKK